VTVAPGAEGALIIAGIGIEWASQTTAAAREAIARADRVLFAVANPWAARWIRTLKPEAEALPYPRDGRPRREIYAAMVDRIMEELGKGGRVCAAFYGHPGVLVAAGHEAIRRARAEGYGARMLPGISSLDCLFADLGVDPGAEGCLIFEAGVLVERRTAIDPRTPLVLHQIALIDNHGTFEPEDAAAVQRGLCRLQERLATAFPRDHRVVIYEAATHPLHGPRVETVRLCALAEAAISEVSTLYIPAVRRARLFCAPTEIQRKEGGSP
jgi:uncharacterized protein YabN with tetrapyrrole methylase and pyrophosphatase domain